MPLVDLPLRELHSYAGRNPRPADFDAFWDDALDQMRTLDPHPEFIPAEFQLPGVECFHLYFTGVGGARIHAKYLRPAPASFHHAPTSSSHGPATPKHPALLHFHGYSGASAEWAFYLQFVFLGFSVAALDCRGQGGLSHDPGGVRGNTWRGHIVRGLDDSPQNLYYRQVYLDTAQLADIVFAQPGVDPSRVAACGGSQGGGLALACAALEPRIARVAAAYPFLCDFQRVWEMDLCANAYEEIKMWFRLFDPGHERESEIFNRLGYIDVQHLAPRIRAHAHFLVNLADTICPPSTQFAVYNKITAPKEMWVCPDFAHETPPGYGDRVLQFFAHLLHPQKTSQ